jgi:hypothetical protein
MQFLQKPYARNCPMDGRAVKKSGFGTVRSQMPALVAVVLNPVTVSMLVVCSAGVIFMIRFLIALVADERKYRATYLIQFEPSEQKRSGSSSEQRRYGKPFEEESYPGLQMYRAHSMPASRVSERPSL